jgi:hypothetical protein
MKSENQSSASWLIPAAAFAGAAAFAWGAVLMLHQAFAGHSGRIGIILRVGLSLGSLFAGVFCVAVGTLYRLSFQQDNGERFH